MPASLPAFASHAPLAVGGVLLLAGYAKALDTMDFVRHLERFPGFTFSRARLLGPAVVVGQCALGTALCLRLWPSWLVPLTMGAILTLGGIAAWAHYRAGVESCGCYGGLFHPTVPQSLVIDTGLVALLALAWLAGPSLSASTAALPLSASGAAAALAAVLSAASWGSVRRRGRPLVVWSPIREGRRWQPRWLGDSTPYGLDRGEHLVAFLSLDCPRCNEWMDLLRRAVQPHPRLPKVLGVMNLSETERSELEQLLGFTLATVGPLTIRRLTWTMPFGVLVDDGIVRGIWADRIPETFLNRLRQAYAMDLQGPSATSKSA